MLAMNKCTVTTEKNRMHFKLFRLKYCNGNNFRLTKYILNMDGFSMSSPTYTAFPIQITFLF